MKLKIDGSGQRSKITLLHGDPFFEEAAVEKCGPFQDTLALELGRDMQENF